MAIAKQQGQAQSSQRRRQDSTRTRRAKLLSLTRWELRRMRDKARRWGGRGTVVEVMVVTEKGGCS